MRRATTVVVGAGHSGLAMSRCLAERSVDHVVLERGEVAHSWRTRWDSLRLLTPTSVTSVRADPGGYVVRTDRGSWYAPTVVVATGAAAVASVPIRLAGQVPAGITATTPADYR